MPVAQLFNNALPNTVAQIMKTSIIRTADYSYQAQRQNGSRYIHWMNTAIQNATQTAIQLLHHLAQSNYYQLTHVKRLIFMKKHLVAWTSYLLAWTQTITKY